jgi:putative ABC transport system substrate-binding protein
MRRRDFMISLAGAIGGGHSAVRAQQKAMPVIGYLSSTSPMMNAPVLAAFRQGLSDAGYVEGQNVAIEFRWAEGRYDRLPALAADLVDRKVDLIAATGGIVSARAAKNATSSIPIVFIIGTEGVIGIMQEAASSKRVQLHVLKANSETEIDAAFGTLIQRQMDALLVSANPFFDTHREQLLALAARHAVPAMYAWRDFSRGGGLISYGASLADVNRQVGTYAGKILKGAKPANLPVQQPTRFELVVNLNTAKALGLTIPHSLLLSADEVIE